MDFVKEGWSQRNDLFIKLKYKNQIRQTTIKWNDLNPVWNEAFIFDYDGIDSLLLQVYDSNLFDKNIIILEENIPVFMGDIQEFNIGKIKLHMGDATKNLEIEKILIEKEKIIENLRLKNSNLEYKFKNIKNKLTEIKDILNDN